MLRMSHGVILSMLALIVIGIVMVNSAMLEVKPDEALVRSGAMSREVFERLDARYEPISFESVFFGRPAVLALLAFGALFGASRIDPERIMTARGARSLIPWILGAIVVTLALTQVPGVGREVNGSARWIGPAFLGFQPSELAKWGMLAIVSWFCVRHADRLQSFKRGFLPALAVIAFICALIGKEDLGTAALVFVSCSALLMIGGMRWWYVAGLVPVGAIGAIAAVKLEPYRMARLVSYMDPWADPQGAGYHTIQALSAIAGGGFWGRGIGNSLQKFGYLPEDTTDFIFAIICEELGVIGAMLVVMLFASLLLCGLSIVMRGAKSREADALVPPFSRLLGTGILLTIGLQVLINLMVVTGLAPTKGIALPFISSGGSGWVSTGFAVGLLIGIERATARRARELGVTEDGVPLSDQGEADRTEVGQGAVAQRAAMGNASTEVAAA
jgi:cell division protein FtsW